jgi:type II secretory pathway component PulC
MGSNVQLSTEDRLKKLERQNLFLKACLAISGLFFASIIALLLNLSLSARQMKSRVNDLESELKAITASKKAEEESKNRLIKLDFPEINLPETKNKAYPSATNRNVIQPAGHSEFVISRKSLLAYGGNSESIIQQARVIPNFAGVGEDRKVDGIRIYRIQPGGIYELLGIENGDVIKSINGQTIDSLEKALMLLQGFWKKDSFTVTIERKGQTFECHYRVE